jgi:hypothetical protein
MYACVHETGSGLFGGVCPPSTTTSHLHDQLPPLDSRIASGTQPAKVSITGLGDGFP